MDEKSTANGLSWSDIYKLRQAIRGSFPDVYRLKIKKKLLLIVLDELKDNDFILEVGASNRDLADKITKVFPTVTYKTMDIDRANVHDYYSLDEVDIKFDVIVMGEVIEHLDINDGIELLIKLKGLLKTGGKIIITTPNIHHPNRYWWDPDHKVPYRYDALGAVLLYVGFDIDGLYRIYNDPILRRMARFFLLPIAKLLDLDFSKSIAAVASNKG